MEAIPQPVRQFEIPRGAIRAQAAIDINASPDHVARVYRQVERWGEIFPLTIQAARVIETGVNWQQIEVAHKMEGRVPNTLIFLSETEIGLEEQKRLFDASFLNQFQPSSGGTRYVLTAYIQLKGALRLLKPLLAGDVRRRALNQMRDSVLEPLKRAVE